MTRYVETVLLPVPSDDIAAYRETASEAGAIWMEHGALAYFEGIEDGAADEDAVPSSRTVADLAGATDDETTVFGFIVFESRAHRDEVTAAVSADPAYGTLFEDGMPFDPGRMATGRFTAIVDRAA